MPPIPFESRRKAPPRFNRVLENNIKSMQRELERLVEKTPIPKPNFSRQEFQAVNELRSRPDVTIIRSDKGGELVIMSTARLNQLTQEHLKDATTYRMLTKDPTEQLREKTNTMLRNILTLREYPKQFVDRFMTSKPATTQRFYALPKTHKPTLKIRPIVCGQNGIFDKVGWLLQNILKPLLTKVKAHITNTQQLVDRFDAIPKEVLAGKIPISFDVRSLYTNIDVDEAISTTLDYAQRYDLDCYSLTLADIQELLELTLKNNVFQYNSQPFLQIRGLAMGGRISGTLAILVMDRFETSHIYNQLLPASLVYMRYVDDTGTIANNIEEAQAMLEYLNDQHPTIKFDLETPDKNGYLPILDVMIKIDEAGEISRKHYRKTANRGLTLNFLSHHASAIKRAIVNNELQRAYDYSTVDNRTSAVQEAKKKLSNNNYPDKWLHPKAKSRKSQKPKPVYDSVLRLPFISDSFNAKVRRVLKQSNLDNVRLVNPRPKTLQQLVTKRSQPQSCPLRKCPISQSVQNCGATFVIYKATCLMCGDFYVGSTMRPLHIRAREHMYATRQHNSSSALGEHFGERHPTAATPSIEFEILHRSEKNELRLRIDEAYYIQRLQPPLNRKAEHLGTGFLL